MIQCWPSLIPAGKTAEKEMWGSAFLAIWHCILNANSTKNFSSGATFQRFCHHSLSPTVLFAFRNYYFFKKNNNTLTHYYLGVNILENLTRTCKSQKRGHGIVDVEKISDNFSEYFKMLYNIRRFFSHAIKHPFKVQHNSSATKIGNFLLKSG